MRNPMEFLNCLSEYLRGIKEYLQKKVKIIPDQSFRDIHDCLWNPMRDKISSFKEFIECYKNNTYNLQSEKTLNVVGISLTKDTHQQHTFRCLFVKLSL